MPRKHRKTPEHQKIIDGNTPMMTAPSGRKYPMTDKQKAAFKQSGFQPGKSGNPAGRPPLPEELKEKIAYMTPDAIDKVYELMSTSDNAMVQLKAAELLIGTQISKAATKQEIEVEVTHSDFLTKLAQKRGIIVDAVPLVEDHSDTND